MKVSKNLITPAKPFVYEGPLDVSLFSPRPGYGVKSLLSCDVEAEIYLEEDEYASSPRLFASIYAKSALLREDSRSLEEFEQTVEVDEEVEILNSILDEGEGYVFPERSFDLEELVYAMIHSDLPPARREDTPLPEGGIGYEVHREGQEKDEGVTFYEVKEEGEEDE